MSETKSLNHYFQEAGCPSSGQEPIILFADIDGTLVGQDMKISPMDEASIKKFMDRGHFFTMATGRGRTNAEFHMNSLVTNFPAVFANGALLIDRQNQEVIVQHDMSTADLDELFLIMKSFYPDIMIQIYTADAIYLITANEDEDPRVENHQPYQRVEFERLRGINCNKVLFGMQDQNCDEGKELAHAYVKEHLADLRVVKSQSKYLELTPRDVSKGRMLEFIKAQSDALIAVAGDYYNDIEMMKVADIAYTLSSSPREVMDAADEILDSKPGEFISQVIEDLLNRKG